MSCAPEGDFTGCSGMTYLIEMQSVVPDKRFVTLVCFMCLHHSVTWDAGSNQDKKKSFFSPSEFRC